MARIHSQSDWLLNSMESLVTMLESFKNDLTETVSNSTSLSEYDNYLHKWLRPVLEDQSNPWLDRRLCAYLDSTFTMIDEYVAGGMYGTALITVDEAIAEIGTYDTEDVEMEQLGGRVWTADDMEAVAVSIFLQKLLCD